MLFGQQECPRMYVATHMYTEIKNKMFPHSLVHRDQKQNVPPLTRTQRSKTKCSPTHLSTEIKNKMFPPLTRTQRSKTKCSPLTCTQRSKTKCSPNHTFTKIKTKCSPTHMYTEIKNKMFPHSHVHRDQKRNVPYLWIWAHKKFGIVGHGKIQHDESIGLSPYTGIIFILRMLSVYYICCIYSGALETRFHHGYKHCEPWSNQGPHCLQYRLPKYKSTWERTTKVMTTRNYVCV